MNEKKSYKGAMPQITQNILKKLSIMKDLKSALIKDLTKYFIKNLKKVPK